MYKDVFISSVIATIHVTCKAVNVFITECIHHIFTCHSYIQKSGY